MSTSEQEIDPFEAFDRAMGAETGVDPYPGFAALRAQGGIVERKGADCGMSLFSDPDQRIFAAVSHDAVSEVLRDGRIFSSGAYRETMGLVMGPNILVMDEPDHGRLRSSIQKAFSKKALERWETDLVRPVVNDLVDQFVDRGSAELVRELTFPFPVHVIAGMLGLPAEDLPQFHAWAVDVISVAIDFERGIAGSKALGEYLTPILSLIHI